MNDKQQQFRNIIVYLMPLGVSAFIPLITLPVFTRILTVQDFGVLALAQIYGIFAGGVATFGMSTAYERNFFKYQGNPEDEGKLLVTSLAFVTVTYTAAGLVSFVFRGVISSFIIGSPGHGSLLMWALLTQYAVTANLFFMTELKNSERAGLFSIAQIATILLNMVFAIALVAWVGTGVAGLLYAQTAAYTGVSILMGAAFLRRCQFAFSARCLAESLQIGLPLTPRIFLGVINTQFDKFMIGILTSVGGVGIYDIGQKVSRAVFTCMTAIQNVYSPAIYRQMFELRDAGRETIGRYLTPFAYVSIGFAVGAALVAEEVITLLTPPAFYPAIDVVIVLSMYYGFLFFGKVNGNQIIFMKKTGVTSLLTIVAITLNIALNIPFILKWGAVGAAWATMLASLISGLVSFTVAQRYYAIRWNYRSILPMLGVLYIAAFGLLIMRRMAVDYAVVVGLKVTAALAYLIVGYRHGILNRDTVTMVAGLFKRRTPSAKMP